VSNADTHEIILPANEETEQEVAEFLANNSASHYRQSFDWVRAVGEKDYRLFVTREDGAISAVSFVEILRSRLTFISDARIARGPVSRDERALVSHLGDLEDKLNWPLFALRISPFVPPGSVSLPPSWRRMRNSSFYSSTLIFDTRNTVEELWRQLRRSTRTAINKSRKAGLNIVRCREASQFADFVTRFNDFAQQRGIAKIDDSMASGLAEHFADQALLLEIRRDEQPLAGALFLRNPNGLVYEFGWTAPASESDNLPLMHRLIWNAIEYCRKEHYSEFDLGGYWVDRGPEDPINHFKLGFSKQRRDYVVEHEIVLSPVWHKIRQAFRRFLR
jgi:lipid II:glycine glycyltransferase (peptidoglycan interpeptide bridge formation enzyme)